MMELQNLKQQETNDFEVSKKTNITEISESQTLFSDFEFIKFAKHRCFLIQKSEALFENVVSDFQFVYSFGNTNTAQ